MKLFFTIVLLSVWKISLCGITITGKVVDSTTGSPLEYVSIGVVNSSIGTITDHTGSFKLDVSDQPTDAVVRFSMISYKSQTFSINELSAGENNIQLVSAPVKLADVVVKPGKLRKVGVTSYTRLGNWCGWGGSQYRKGHEIGTKIELGNSMVFIKSLHFHIHRQAFDSSFFRLHIRSINNNTPDQELLTQNIIFPVTKESGWVAIDLSKYNIFLKGEVALTLEWVKVKGTNSDRAMTINKKIWSEYILINEKRNKGILYSRWSTESKWNLRENNSPGIYLTVQ